MTPQESVLEVIDSMIMEWSDKRVTPTEKLVDLGFDSLDIVNLELNLREEFQNEQIHLNITPNDTVQNVIDAVKLTLPY